ncbi:VOC family protein [Nonomuraea typhae]|uniref:VOC family protein n=1 Tax=Nonomuraea typhae TaxID=2603600 RepID=UPI0012FCDFFC|nr:VOC family protein [Nonomuraea typhae]
MDHLVFATPYLRDTVHEVGRLLGVHPVEGGRHVGLGTRNHLLGLGGRRYLEIVGPDEDQPDPESPRPFGIDTLTAPRLITWAVEPPDLDEAIARARDVGYDPGPAVPMSRRTPAGDLLEWRLTLPHEGTHDGVVPFLIDWGTTPHPSGTLPEVKLAAFHAGHPDPDAVLSDLAALGAELEVRQADAPVLVATFAGGQTLS